MSSPSGAPVTAYCILAVAPGRTGWSSASLRDSSNHSWVRYFAIWAHLGLLAERAGSLLRPSALPLARRGARPQAGEEVVFEATLGDGGVDHGPGEEVLLPGEH